MNKSFFLTLLCAAFLYTGITRAEENIFREPGFESEGMHIVKGTDDKTDSFWVKFADRKLSGGASLVKDCGLDVSLDKSSDFIEGKVSLKIDASKSEFPDKKRPTIRLYGIDISNVKPGKKHTIEVWAKADREKMEAKLYLEGKNGGKHFWKATNIILGKSWKKYSFTTLIPEDIENLHGRFDCCTPAIYWLDGQSAFVAKDTDAQAPADDRNWVVNGNAEREWYCTGATTYENRVSVEGKLFNWRGEAVTADGFTSWEIDDTQAVYGKRSFKGTAAEKGGGGRICFNPVPFENGKPACLSVYLKSNRKQLVNMSLFMCSGIAYAKSIVISDKWKKYTLYIPSWGAKVKGISRIGDVSGGYGVPLKLVTPTINVSGNNGGVIWIDGIDYHLGAEREFTDDSTLWLRGRIDRKTAYYFKDETIKAELEIENVKDTDRVVEIVRVVENYFGEEVERSEPEKAELPAGATIVKNYAFTPAIKGAFNLRLLVRDVTEKKVYDHNVFLGVIDRDGKAYPQLGLDIDTKHNIKRLVPYLRDFGVGSVRVWSVYQKALGTYMVQPNIPILKKAGLYVLFNVSNMMPAIPNPYMVPKDTTQWERFFTKIVQENKGMVDCYEIANEPNIWGGRVENPDPEKYDFMTPETYVRFLKAAHKVVKANDPKAKLGGPTTCHTDVVWTANVLANDGKKYLDVITEHPYREKPEAPDYALDARGMKAIMKNVGLDAPIFASEAGNLTNAILPNALISDKMRNSTARSIRIQIIGFSEGIKKYFHFHSKLWPMGSGWQTFFMGNPGNDGVAIPNTYLFASRALGDRIGEAESLGAVDMGTAVRCYAFEKNDRRVLALWKCEDEDRESTISLKLDPGKFSAYDIVGGKMEAKLANDECVLPLRGSPMYIETEMELDEIARTLTSAAITGIGKPFKSSLTILGARKFAIQLSNRHNRPLSGKIEILTDGIVEGETAKTFADFAPGSTNQVQFASQVGIDTSPRTIKARISISGMELFEVKEFSLQTMLCPRAKSKITLDADLSEWENMAPVVLDINNAVKTKDELWKRKDEKIKAEIKTCWDDEFFYAAVIVDKPVFYQNANDPSAVWQGDSFQISFDTLKNGNPDIHYYGDDDFEYSIALFKGKPIAFRHYASSVIHDGFQKTKGLLKDEVKMAIKKLDGKVIYEMAFPPQSISPFRLAADNSMRWDIIVNLNNGEGRMGWLELTPGIGQRKSPGEFMNIVLTR